MKIPLQFLLLVMVVARTVAQEAVPGNATVRFHAVDIYIESKGKPLAAYQIDFSVQGGAWKIVGIEGGEHPAFRAAPCYDPAAMQKERAIIAAFSTEAAMNLPQGRTRVATIHLQTTSQSSPDYKLKLETAASADGVKMPAEASFEERK